MKLKFIKRLLVLSLAFLFVLNTSIIFAEDKINIPKSIQIYYTAADAKNRVNSKGYWSAGDYYIFTKYDGMINISYSNSEPGAWINPNDIGSNSDIVITPNIPILRIETQINRYSSFVVYSDMKAYRSASDAYKSTNPVTTLSSGIYYVLSASNNMLEISSTKSNSGYWINPARNSGFYKTANDYTTWDFINEIGPLAQKLAAENDLYASVMMAQAILESGWGNSLLANKPFHNLFGVKGSYNGDSILIKTFEYTNGGSRYDVLSNFRKYPSYMESLKDYVYVLTGDDDPSSWNYKFYLGVRKSRTSNYREATNYLTGRYATSPAYANSLNSLIENYNLTKFDTEAEKLGPVVSGYITRSYNLRDGASLNSKIVGLLKAGTYVKGNIVGDFIKLSNGKYVYKSNLLPKLERVKGYLLNNSTVANNPDGSKVTTYKQTTYVEGYDLGDWILLDNGQYLRDNGLTQYKISEYLSGYITKDINIRNKPSSNGKVVGEKKAYQYVKGYRVGNYIRLSETEFIYKFDLLPELNIVEGYITRTMNVRSQARLDSKVLRVEKAGNYVKGYLIGNFIHLLNGGYMYNTKILSELNYVSGYIKEDSHLSNNPGGSTIPTISSGSFIEGYDLGEWILLKTGKYLSSKELTKYPIGEYVKGYTTRSINVRNNPSPNSSVIGIVKLGEYVEGYVTGNYIRLSETEYIYKFDLLDELNYVKGYLLDKAKVVKLPGQSEIQYYRKNSLVEGYDLGKWILIENGNYVQNVGVNETKNGQWISGKLLYTMNNREEASLDSKILGQISAGTYIQGYLYDNFISLDDGTYIYNTELR